MKLKFLVFTALSSLFVISCSSLIESSPSRLEQKPQIQSASPDILSRYSAFYVPEINILTIEGDALRRVDDSEVERLVADFRNKIIRQLGSKHTMFSQPAKNIGVIKVTVTDVSTTYALFQLYPGAIIPNALRGGASIEANITDSQTGQLLVNYKHSRQGERQGFLSGLGKWDGLKKAFDEWARELGAAVKK